MSTTVIVGWASEDRLADAVFTADTAPIASYSLSTFGYRNPAERIRWDVTDLALTATVGAAVRGDVLVIPACNLDEGDELTTVLRLTNGAGLDVPVPVPARRVNGQARTIVLDLTELASAGTRTSTVWTLEVVGNSVDIIFGGFIGLFAKRTIAAMQWGITAGKTQHASQVVNDHGGRYRVNLRTTTRTLAYALAVEATELPEAEDWHDANEGLVEPGLLWVQRDELDAIVGTLDEAFLARQRDGMDVYDITGTFTELSKGKPV